MVIFFGRSNEFTLAARGRRVVVVGVETEVAFNFVGIKGCNGRLTRGTDCAWTIMDDNLGTSMRRKSFTGVLGQLCIRSRNRRFRGFILSVKSSFSLAEIRDEGCKIFVPHLAVQEDAKQGELLHFGGAQDSFVGRILSLVTALMRESFKSYSLTIP